MESNVARTPKTNGHARGDTAASDAAAEISGVKSFADARAAANELLAEKAADIASETLTGDLRDFILDRLRHEQNKQPWHLRSEADQRETVHQVESAVRAAVTRAVEIIAAKGQKAITATLTQVTFKDGIKASIELSKHNEQRHALADAQGGTIVIFVVDPEEFDGERGEVTITPDQGDLERTLAVHSDDDSDRRENPLN